MKKLLAMLVAFTLILALAFCGPSASADLVLDPETSSRPEDNVVGVWFFQLEETILRLELLPDGTYTLGLDGLPEESSGGVWRLEDGFVWLDDSEQPLSVAGDLLFLHSLGVYATREEPLPIYRAVETVEAPVGTMDGYWIALFLEVDGQVFSTELLGESLDLYVEGLRAAMGGPIFGDRIVDLEEEDGALVLAGEGFRVTMELQADGFMRLTLSGDFEGELYYYLMPVLLEEAVDADA